MKKRFFYMIATVLLVFNMLEVQAAEHYFYEDFGPFSNVELDKEWEILFNQSGNINESVSIRIEDSSKNIVPIREAIEGNKIILQPKNPYKANEQFTLYIARTLDSKLKHQQKINFTTKNQEINSPSVEQRKSEIQNKWNLLKPLDGQVEYIEHPSITAPYQLGKLTDNTLNEALDISNFIRYISYLPQVKLDQQFNVEAQAAALVNAANSQLSHYPSQPVDMDYALFELGAKGASSSNIGVGYPNIIDSIVSGYMNDGDPSNISRVGHRRWILSPKLEKVGFGFADITGGYYSYGYTAMKVIDTNMYRNPSEPYDFISWPAKTAMPTEFFQNCFPWSVSLNPEIYTTSHLSEVEVKLTRLKDRKTWHMSENSNDGYFNIDTGNYGHLPYTIIFRPDDQPDYMDGDQYQVTISNLRKHNGEKAELTYETTFFHLK